VILLDVFNRKWITENAREIIAEYPSGITIRQLHYRLVARGMINDIQHYKRVVTAMTMARWDGVVSMQSFIDRERSMYGETKDDEKDVQSEIDNAKNQIEAWMGSYYLNPWSNQDNYVEVWIEKKALQGVFEAPCKENAVGLAPCKGYPSLSFLYEAAYRFQQAGKKGMNLVILYFGDFDPSGEDIPRSIESNMARLGLNIDVVVIALHPAQIDALHLPGVPPKQTDTRTKGWDGGSVVELDAVEPKLLSQMCRDAINEYWDEELHRELIKKTEEERIIFREELKTFVQGLGKEGDKNEL